MRSDSDIEVLPHRARIVFNMGLPIVLWILGFIAIGGRLGADGFRIDVSASLVSFSDGVPTYLLGLFTAIFGVSILLSAISFRANATPRIVAGKGGVVVVGFWRTRGFAWSEFGAFKVQYYRRNKSTTVAIRAMPPSAPDESLGAIADWLIPDNSILRLDSSLLTVFIAPFVPPFKVTLDRGEEIAKWLCELRTNPAARPPNFLRVRATSGAKSAAKANSTVVRR